jgi:D-alanyl-D-alanine carboxypeptidase
VTLGSPLYDRDGNADFSVYTDQKNLYEWAFNTFSYQKLLSTDREITEIDIEFGVSDHVLLVPADEYMSLWPSTMDTSTLKEDIDLAYVPESGIIPAPVNAGDVYGTYTLSYSGEVLVTVPLVAKNSVERDELSFLTDKASKFPQSRWFKAAIVMASTLTVIYTAIFIAVAVSRNKKSRNNSRLFKK